LCYPRVPCHPGWDCCKPLKWNNLFYGCWFRKFYDNDTQAFVQEMRLLSKSLTSILPSPYLIVKCISDILLKPRLDKFKHFEILLKIELKIDIKKNMCGFKWKTKIYLG